MCEPRLFLSLMLGTYSFRKRRTQQIMASGVAAMNSGRASPPIVKKLALSACFLDGIHNLLLNDALLRISLPTFEFHHCQLLTIV